MLFTNFSNFFFCIRMLIVSNSNYDETRHLFFLYISNLFQNIVFATQIRIQDSRQSSAAVFIFTVFEMTKASKINQNN